MSTIEPSAPREPASPAPSPCITQTHGLGHAWGEQLLFQQLDLVIPCGVTLLQGGEQSGKTTLLRILAGEIRPTIGRVLTLGQCPEQQPTAYAQTVFRSDPTNPALDPISPAQWFASLPERFPLFQIPTLNALAEGFGLRAHMDKPMYMLSAGSRRKVGLSAAMASGAALTLIDQPFAALDRPSVRLLIEVLQDFGQSGHRACVLADYEAPPDVVMVDVIHLPDRA